MIKIFLLMFSICLFGDPEGKFNIENPNQVPYMEWNDHREVLPRHFRALKDGMSANYWNYKAHFSAIAQIRTPGYKRYKFTAYMDQETGDITALQYIDWAKEYAIATNRALDLYISGRLDFFLLEPSDDVDLYTMDGRFTRDDDGLLISIAHRRPVMGVDGYIYLETDNPMIDNKGNIYENEEKVGQFKIVSFKSPKGLWTIDGTVFYQREPNLVELSDDSEYSLAQGFLESQNEPPGMMTSKLMAPFAEGTAKSTKKLIDSYELMFKAVSD